MNKLYIKKVPGSPHPEFIHNLVYLFINTEIEPSWQNNPDYEYEIFYNNSSPFAFVIMSEYINFQQNFQGFLDMYRSRAQEFNTPFFFNEEDILNHLNIPSLHINNNEFVTVKPTFVSFRNNPNPLRRLHYDEYNYQPPYPYPN